MYRASKFAATFAKEIGRPLPRGFFGYAGSEVAIRSRPEATANALASIALTLGRDAAYIAVLRNPEVMFVSAKRAVHNVGQLASVLGATRAAKLVITAPGLLGRRDIANLAQKL